MRKSFGGVNLCTNEDSYAYRVGGADGEQPADGGIKSARIRFRLTVLRNQSDE